MKRWGLLIFVVFILIFSHLTIALNSSVDQALNQLKTYKLGDDSKPLQTIEDAVVRSHSDSAVRAKILQAFRQVLQSETSFGAKRFVCRQLALIGTDNEISALAGLLPNPELSSLARYALARIPGEKVDQALIAALNKTQGREKLGIINTLGNRRSRLAVERLGELMLEQNREIATEAVRALGRIGTKTSQKLLSKVNQHTVPFDPLVYADAYLECADQLASEGNPLAIQCYQEIFFSNFPGHLRAAALRGMVECDPEQGIQFVVVALADVNPKLCQMAATLARDIPESKATKAFVNELPNRPPSVQVQLIHALADRGDQEALSAITNTIKSDVPAVRIAALEALGKLGDASSIEVLVSAATSASDKEQKTAIRSLTILRGERIHQAMIDRLKSTDDERRVVLIRVLNERNAVESVPYILGFARSKKTAVRDASFKALRTLATPRDIQPLIDFLIYARKQDLKPIRNTLLSLVRRYSCEEQVARDILKLQEQAQTVQQRCNVLLGLGDMGVASTLPILREALQEGNQEIRYAAIRALSAWPDAEPIPDLLHVIRTSETKTHRILALRVYIQLLDKAKSLSAQKKLQRYQETMKLAESDQEKKRILGALANVKTVATLQYVKIFLSNANLKQEAAQACIAIAQVVYAWDASATKAAMEAVLTAGVMDSFQQQGRKIIKDIDALKSYLANWEVAGPYVQENKNYSQLFDIKFGPELTDTEVQWKPMTVTKLNNHPAYLDLLATLNGGEQRVAYLRTQIESVESKDVRLEIFSDDGVKAWLNGKLVLSLNVARPILENPDVADVKLKKGTNHLMLKVTQNNMPWGAMVRIRTSAP